MNRIDLVMAVMDFVEQGKLAEVPLGYCGRCGQERTVYEPGDEYPAQPPTCLACLVDACDELG